MGRGGDDAVVSASFPGVAKEFIESTYLNLVFRGKNGHLFISFFEDVVNIMSNDAFTGGAGDADNAHIF